MQFTHTVPALILEIQGRVEDMATRIVVYGGLATQRERKQLDAPGKAPPRLRALRVVLYHGPGSWTASRRSWELFGDKYAVCDVMQSSLKAEALENQRKGRREGLRHGLRWLRRLAARKFDAETERKFGALLERIADPARLNAAADAVMDSGTSDALLRAVRRLAAG